MVNICAVEIVDIAVAAIDNCVRRTLMSDISKKNVDSVQDTYSYERTGIKKEIILQRLKEQGMRITKQRLMLLDIIINEECSCCKEIYFKATKRDPKIGTATVYRMINTLEQIGAINRKNMYRIDCNNSCGIKYEADNMCTIEFNDNTVINLSVKRLNQIIESGLTACGYHQNHGVRGITTGSCACTK